MAAHSGQIRQIYKAKNYTCGPWTLCLLCHLMPSFDSTNDRTNTACLSCAGGSDAVGGEGVSMLQEGTGQMVVFEGRIHSYRRPKQQGCTSCCRCPCPCIKAMTTAQSHPRTHALSQCQLTRGSQTHGVCAAKPHPR
eukprot:301522-Chlamydomonas_euryale.AAC.2